MLLRAILVMFLTLASSAWADVYLCNGRYTSTPCDQGTTVVITAPSKDSGNNAARLLSQKRSLLHDIRMKSIEAKRSYGVRFDLSPLEEFCLKTDATAEACSEKVKVTDRELDEKIQAAAAIKQEEEKLRLQREANQLQEDRNKIEKNKPSQVTVIRTTTVPYYTSTTLPPGGSSSISIQGSAGGVSISVQESNTVGKPLPVNPLPPGAHSRFPK